MQARILILDDSKQGRYLLQKCLYPQHELIFALNISHAMQMLRTGGSFNLIICGVHLQDESALDFLKALKSDHELTSIPFIYLRAHDGKFGRQLDDTVKTSTMALGATDYIVCEDKKDLPELCRSIHQHLPVPLSADLATDLV